MSNSNVKENTKIKTDSTVKEKFEIKRPKRYKILLHNNDVTWPEAVVNVLRSVFQKQGRVAQDIMMHAHMHGQAIVEAPVTKEIGETKLEQAKTYCKQQHQSDPYMRYNELVFTIEEDGE